MVIDFVESCCFAPSQRAKVVTPSLATPPHSGEGKDEAASMGGYYPGVPRFWLRVMMNNREVWAYDLFVIQQSPPPTLLS